VADAWDAMTVARFHVAPLSPAEALDQLQLLAGEQFCPVAVTRMLTLHEQGSLADSEPGGAPPGFRG
jgi:HD-GYP domain-containing protein (c-di-GMP phosphodiesterase class II)